MAVLDVPLLGPAEVPGQVLASSLPVLLDVTTAWCQPCHLLTPVLPRLAVEFTGRLRVIQLDADAAPHWCDSWQVDSFPTLLLLRGGLVIERLVGFAGYPELRARLDPMLARALGIRVESGPADVAYWDAVTEAEADYADAVGPAEAALAAAQAPHLPGYEAALAAADAALAAGRIDRALHAARRDAAHRAFAGPLQRQVDAWRAAVERAAAPRANAFLLAAGSYARAQERVMARATQAAAAAAQGFASGGFASGGFPAEGFCPPGAGFCTR